MFDNIIAQVLAVGGPFGAICIYMLWRCVSRQDAREDRFAQSLAENTAALQEVSGKISATHKLVLEHLVPTKRTPSKKRSDDV